MTEPTNQPINLEAAAAKIAGLEAANRLLSRQLAAANAAWQQRNDENAQLFEEIQRLLKGAKQHAQELAAISTVSQALVAETELDSLIQLIGNQMRDIFKADIVYLALFNPQTNLIHFPYQFGESFTTLKLGEGLTSKIIETGEPLLINRDIAKSHERIGATPVGIEVLSYLGVPIQSRGKTIGVLSVQSITQKDFFDEDSRRLLTTIAANAGAAIHTVQLHAEAERRAREMAALAEVGREISATLELGQEASQAKSAFLATMSHELRTPLNAIIGFTRIVRRKAKGALDERQLDNLEKVLTSAEHLLGLINTILDIAKIEAGRMDVLPTTFQATQLVEACATTARPLLQPGVDLVAQIEPKLPLLYSDHDKLKQILLNLLSNAAKFTHEGHVTVRASRRGEMLVVDVTDTGIGIPADKLDTIFEEFQQVDSSNTRQYGGTGLGLSISRHLAQLLRGNLTATSVAGQGSTFTLAVPIRYGDEAPTITISPLARQPAIPPTHQLTNQPTIQPSIQPTILAIDDDPNVIFLLQENLGDAGYRVVGAASGDEGLARARQLQPQAITLDVMMPDKDGWQVLHELKSDPATKAIPVILLSIVDKKALGYRLGAADYLVKPLDEAAVLAALRRLIEVNGGQALTRLLVVDDAPEAGDMVRQLLAETEYEVSTAPDGLAALEAIHQQRPDAILLDLMMPRLDGFALLEQLRQDPDTCAIPIVVLTARSLTAAEAAVLRESAVRIMQKQGLAGEELIRALQHPVSQG